MNGTVAIIGAGVAGLAAARLTMAGRKVEESREGILSMNLFGAGSR
ncbi:MAG: hypothetical protein JWL77_3783 [Chthonomonadaceae bacterium]|nr:hypothetical protein [Chthonomonadaceae bacterium]